MNSEFSPPPLPAPCIVEQGIVVNKDDMQRILSDLGQVGYHYQLEGKWESKGQGWILEVFRDSQQSTIVTNQSLYLNVNSFDYLQLGLDSRGEATIDLFQENRQLRLIPINNQLSLTDSCALLLETDLEAVVSGAIAAQWDMQQDQNLGG